MVKIILLLAFTVNSFAFTLVGSALATYEDAEITVNVGDQACSNLTETPAEILDLVEEAIEDYWNTVSTSNIKLIAGKLKTVDSAYYTDELCNSSSANKMLAIADGRLKKQNPEKLIPSGIAACAPEVSSGILIVCNDNSTTFSTSGIIASTLPNNISGTTIVGSIIAINDRPTTPEFSKMARSEQVAVLAHEIGHAIGLGHSNFKDSLMYASSISTRAQLGRDDWDGATFLYPKEQAGASACGTIESINNDQQGPFTLFFFSFLTLFLFINFKIRRKLRI